MTRRTDVAPDPLPRHPDVERALVGALIVSGDLDAIAACATALEPSDFTVEAVRAAYVAILALAAADKPVDAMTVAAAGIPVALVAELSSLAAPSAYAAGYADILAHAATRRRLIGIAGDLAAAAYRGEPTAAEIAASAALALAPATASAADDEAEGCIADELAGIDAGTDPRVTWPTTVRPLDESCGGLAPGDIAIVAGYTGLGKTWLAATLANAAIDRGKAVLFVSLEMTKRQVAARVLRNRVARSSAPDDVARREAHAVLGDPQALRVRTNARSVAAIGALTALYQPDVVIVDYAQILAPADSRATEYAANTSNAHALQALAKRAGCAVVVLSQLSRETNRGHALGAAGFGLGVKSSNAWEEVADVGLLVRGIWAPNSDANSRPDAISLTLVKCRHGRSGGSATYDQDGATGRLVERAPESITRAPSVSWAEMAGGAS